MCDVALPDYVAAGAVQEGSCYQTFLLPETLKKDRKPPTTDFLSFLPELGDPFLSSALSPGGPGGWAAGGLGRAAPDLGGSTLRSLWSSCHHRVADTKPRCSEDVGMGCPWCSLFHATLLGTG